MTAADHVDRTRKQMTALLEKKGYALTAGICIPRILYFEFKKKKKTGFEYAQRLHVDYHANLALGECVQFQHAWDLGKYEDAAKHAYLARKHHSEATVRRSGAMDAVRAGKPKRQSEINEALLDLVRNYLKKTKGIGTAAQIHRGVNTGKKLRAFQGWFSRMGCVEMRNEIREAAKSEDSALKLRALEVKLGR